MNDTLTNYPDLPKWPALLVTGTPITEDQAAEILVRTTSTSLWCNDKAWQETVRRIMGIPSDDYIAGITSSQWEAQRAAREAAWARLGVLDLGYLTNYRIMSSWIGGPYGWCDWDGTIGCADFNIGKWPSVAEVRNDWELIAAAWPFLDLRCQLMSGETCEEDTVPLVEFVVKDGGVRVVDPEEVLRPVVPVSDAQVARMFLPGGERGCTEGTLRGAVDVVLSRMGAILWGHGYGSKRHVVDPSRTVARWRNGPQVPISLCSPADPHAFVTALDNLDRDLVMRLKPCLRCCKRLGIDPSTGEPLPAVTT